ncbi:S1 family peptidase [Aquirhabdus parva]|uniref:Serine protease n=1 Tax=Aquirhabdus parva TaxID=2283318 RepID=A0A345P578_9GAMM|nr:serine protease [Aquirhabdus parva]AXI02437.1 serine protease [Aquirhabdus parva]
MSTKYAYSPIIVSICEFSEIRKTRIPISPPSSHGQDLFPVFNETWYKGLRHAIVPVLLKDANRLIGMGTAFHVDGWGTFLTADHVIDAARKHVRPSTNSEEVNFLYEGSDIYPILLLGIRGVVFGRFKIPDKALASVASIHSHLRKRDDPLADLRGEQEFEAVSDIAIMRLADKIPTDMIGTVPIRLSGWNPKIGETVIAFGFPDLKCEPINEERLQYFLSDGMSASYGRIIALHPEGRGNSTPIIEVEANWPSGMSGGPVFNKDGEVIGIVSRSVGAIDNEKGNGCAVHFELIPWINVLIPSLDKINPGWRLSWAVQNKITKIPEYFFKEKEDAITHQISLGGSYQVVFGSNRIGSNDFIILDDCSYQNTI